MELFELQSNAYKNKIYETELKISIVGSKDYWKKYVGIME